MLVRHSDAPGLDANRIILHVLAQRDASYLLAHGEEIISEQDAQKILEMAEARKTGMPLAYVLGEADFFGRTFAVTQDVLIPRPDTEALIEKALEYIKVRHAGLRPGIHVDSGSRAGMTEKKEIVIADLCTGSGIIAITLALELQDSAYNLQHTTYDIVATDISDKALAVAKQNAKQHGVADRIEFLQGDMLEPIKNKKIDLLVSNPPYVPSEELASIYLSLHRERTEERVSDRANDETLIPSFSLSREKVPTTQETRGLLFEPQIALDGGEDGLKFVNQIKEYAQKNNTLAIIETVGGKIATFP